jgi:CHAT domain-containing protein/Flp pilus assembly protein TadD
MRFSKFTFSTILIVAIAALAPAFYAQSGVDEKAELKAKGSAEFAEGDKLLNTATVEGAKAALPRFKAAAEYFKRAEAWAEQAESMLLAGRSAEDSGDTDTGILLYKDSIPIYKKVDGHEGEAVAHNNIGRIYFSRGEMAEARVNFEKAEQIVTEKDIESVAALVYSNLGRLYDSTGDRLKAQRMFRRSVDAARKSKDKVIEAHGLSNLGKTQNDMGDRKGAISMFEEALILAREVSHRDLELTILNNIGVAWHTLGESIRALEFYGQAQKLIEGSPDKTRLAMVLNNIGKAQDSLGNKQIALDYFRRALPLAEADKDSSLQSAIRNNTGIVYFSLRNLDRARTEYNAALTLARAVGDKNREAVILLNVGTIQQYDDEFEQAIKTYLASLKLAETTLDVKLTLTVLNNLGTIRLIAGETQDARTFFERSHVIAQNTGDREIEPTILNNIGRSFALDGDFVKATGYYNRSLALSRSARIPSSEAQALTNLMDSWDESKNRNVAIFFGKQAVNVYQSLRGNITGLESNLQRSFLESVEGTYRKLAGLLIAAGRIAEAEQVLTMLKKEELIEFVRGDTVAKDLLGSVALSEDERAAIARYGEMADKITAIGAEFGQLEIEQKQFAVGEFPKQARYDELRAQLADASAAFEKFLEDLKIRYGQKDARVVQADAGLQRTLDRLDAHKTAAVATILGEKGIHIIVTTSKTQRAHFVPIDEEKVGKLVTEMRAVLKSASYDPRPASQAVYDILVRPIESDLAGIKADTIVWSLDGALRYIPPAALWTKDKGYLAERFSNVVVSLASRDTLALAAGDGSNWSVLGVGVSKATEGFDPLFAVPEELGCIVFDKASAIATDKCKTGVLPGRRLMDDNFTLARFEGEIGRYPVIHIASHFQLTPGDDKGSFLLLGGGADKRFTVDRLRNQNLSDVDLIVLSACNTATPGGARSNGVEIEGFGSIAHEAGAKSVIATLWSVFDSSTKDTMVEFYRGFQGGKISKAEALRRAQLSVMNGQYKPSEGAAKRGAKLFDGGGEKIPFEIDPKAPFAHPYYWSPFILMGNWR